MWETIAFGLFGSNLDTKDLETYPRTYFGAFLKYVRLLTIPGPFEYFSENVFDVSENQSFLNEVERSLPPLVVLVLGRDVSRLNHGPMCYSQSKTLK